MKQEGSRYDIPEKERMKMPRDFWNHGFNPITGLKFDSSRNQNSQPTPLSLR